MADVAASDLSEEVVVRKLINKRLRKLRRKFNDIIQMEESIARGRRFNKGREEFMRSKPVIAAKIEALENILQPLTCANQEKLSLSLQPHHSSISTDTIGEHKSETPSTLGSNQHTAQVDSSALALEDLLNLIYFGSLFDVKSQSDSSWTRKLERKCCLTYYNVTDDATEPLSEKDLDLISMMSSLLISNPENSRLPHKNVLEQCIKHAKHWIAKSDQLIGLNDNITYAGLRERLNKILSSEYMTIMRGNSVPQNERMGALDEIDSQKAGEEKKTTKMTPGQDLDTPQFYGERVNDWLLKIETLFDKKGTPEESRVMDARPYMNGCALNWHDVFTRYSSSEKVSWKEYRESLYERFNTYTDICTLCTLNQKESVQDYNDKFGRVVKRLEIAQVHKVQFFIRGLKENLKRKILKLYPKSVDEAFEMALLFEYQSTTPSLTCLLLVISGIVLLIGILGVTYFSSSSFSLS